MNASDLAVAADALRRAIGLRTDEASTHRLQRCLTEEASALAVEPAAVARTMGHDPVVLQDVIDRVTVQESWFFREPEQLDALVAAVAHRPGPLRLWSAGCADGQEAWSLAMLLLEQGHRDATVLATDVSTKAVAAARAASYSPTQLRGLSDERRRRWLCPDGARWTVSPALRQVVKVVHHNLVATAPPHAACSAIACRNVLIYLGGDERARLLDRFADALVPGGLLLLATSEHTDPSSRFRTEQRGAAFLRVRLPSPGTIASIATSALGPPQAATPAPPADATDTGEDPPPGPASAGTEPVANGLPSAAALRAQGRQAATSGDAVAAAAAHRMARYLDPDDAIPHFELGLALEATGDLRAADLAFAAARAALIRRGAPGGAAAEMAELRRTLAPRSPTPEAP